MDFLGKNIDELGQQEMQMLVKEIIDKKCRHSSKSWIDLVKEYDLDCSTDTLRKIGVGIDLAQTAGMVFDTESQKHIDRGFTERQKLYDIQRDINRNMREFSRTELICESVREAIKLLPKIEINIPHKKQTKVRKDLLVCMGDFHYGANFSVMGLDGKIINEYDSQVFEKRIGQLLRHIIQICEKENPDQLTIMIVGDMLDGILRASQLQRLEFGVVESSMRFAETFTSWLVKLEESVNIPIRVYAVRGNHGEIRPLGSKAGQFPEENMERIVMHYLYARFEDQTSVLIEDNDAPMTKLIDVCGYKYLLLHGQNTDIESMAKDYVNLYQRPIDAFIIGHLHKTQSFTTGIIPDGNVFVERIPSFCGIDPYAQSKGYGALPGATAILVEEGYGRRCVYPIIF